MSQSRQEQKEFLEESYRKYHPNVKIMENKEILEKVKDKCKDVEFVGKTEPVKAKEIVSDVKGQKGDLDGLLVFGPPPFELIQEGLPIVAVERPLEACSTIPFHAYEGYKVVTSW